MAEGKGHTELPWCTSEAYPFMIEKEVIGLADGHDSYVIAEVKKHSLISSNEALANRNLIITAVNTYPAVEGLVKALEVIEKGGTAVLLDAALTDAPEGFDECPINPKVLEQIVNDARSALSRFRSLQNGGAE